jgi:Zn-finger nucleic acid-binding protein
MMQCISCGTALSSAFKYAFAQNICPACGGAILDEESLALIEDISTTLSSEATLRAETAHKLATSLVARYKVSLREEAVGIPAAQPQKPVAQPKVAPPSAAQQVAKAAPAAPQVEEDPNVISAKDFDGVSEAERDAIMADVVSKKYNMVDGVSAGAVADSSPSGEEFDMLQGQFVGENDENPVLEQERMMRLQKQRQALSGGRKSSFTRSG